MAARVVLAREAIGKPASASLPCPALPCPPLQRWVNSSNLAAMSPFATAIMTMSALGLAGCASHGRVSSGPGVASNATTRPGDSAAAAPGPPPMFSPAACGQITGVLYCDDFESGLNPALKPITANGATIAVDQTRARGGTSALHVKSPVVAKSRGEVALGNPVFPTANNGFFMRVFVYYAPPAAADNVYLFRLNGVVPNTTASASALLGAEGFPYAKPLAPDFKHLSTLMYHSAIKSADHRGYRTQTAPEVTYGRWACWEWEVDGVKNLWRVWIDGVEHFTRMWDGAEGTPWVVPTASELSIGIRHPHEEGPSGVEVWFDDLVVATERVGCGARAR